MSADDARAVVARQVEETTSEEGHIADRPEEFTTPWGPACIVLAVELCERLTYYTLAGSQKTYLNKQLGYTPSAAASLNSVFSMMCYMWCLPGGLLADSVGRYKVIASLASLYALGTVLVAVSTVAGHQEQLKSCFLLGALVLIPIGTGGIKPNICNFGADQIGDKTDKQKEAQKQFFSFFYMSINVGVLVAFGFLANITTHGLPSVGVPLDDGYFFAYVVAAGFMALAVSLFISGTRFYTLLPGGGIEGFQTMVSSISYSVFNGGGLRAAICAVGWISIPLFFVVTIASALWPSEEDASIGSNATLAYQFPNLKEEACGVPNAAIGGRLLQQLEEDFAAPVRRLHGGGGDGGGVEVRAVLNNIALCLGCVSCFCLVVAHLNNKWIKPLPKKRATAFSVEEVRQGFATVPLLIVVNLSYNMAYNAMNNAFPSQACQMNTMIGGSQLNGAFFNLADAVAILVFTPLFETIYHCVGKCKGSPVRLGQKLITGLLVAASANLLAAWMEVKRRQAPLMCWEAVSECAPNGIHMRDMSAFYMFVPFALIGASEILVNPCMYYFAYTAAPPKVRSLVQAFNLFFQGSVSNAFTSVAMEMTFPNDLDTGHLEYYYFLNVLCALGGVLLYFYITRCGDNGEDIKEDLRDEEVDVTEHQYSSSRSRAGTAREVMESNDEDSQSA